MASLLRCLLLLCLLQAASAGLDDLLGKTPPGGVTGNAQNIPKGFIYAAVLIVIAALVYVVRELSDGAAVGVSSRRYRAGRARWPVGAPGMAPGRARLGCWHRRGVRARVRLWAGLIWEWSVVMEAQRDPDPFTYRPRRPSDDGGGYGRWAGLRTGPGTSRRSRAMRVGVCWGKLCVCCARLTLLPWDTAAEPSPVHPFSHRHCPTRRRAVPSRMPPSNPPTSALHSSHRWRV